MSRTLFWYIMRDMLRIFLLASAVFAGILSFGGLLVKMLQVGLTGWQVGTMLMYLMPAMQSVSLSFSALFATTVVYGRLSADNELTACRATGISYVALAMPAVVLGLVLALASLGLWSYVVPHYTLKSEKVVFASLAELIQSSIQRSHQFKIPGTGLAVFAEHAEVLPSPPDAPADEMLSLDKPMFCTYKKEDEKGKLPAPAVFYVARKAHARIRRVGDHVEFWARLDGGMKIPRESENAQIIGFRVGEFGPISVPSPLREQTKFMNVKQLDELYMDPTRSGELKFLYDQITAVEQESDFLDEVADSLKDPRKLYYLFKAEDGEAMLLSLDTEPWRLRPMGSKLRLVSSGDKPEVHLTRLGRPQDARKATLRLMSQREDRLELLLEDVSPSASGAARRQITLPFPTGERARGAAALENIFNQLERMRSVSFDAGEGEAYVLSVDAPAWLSAGATEFTINSSAGPERRGADDPAIGRQIHLARNLAVHAKEIDLAASSDLDHKLMRLEFEMTDAVIGRTAQHTRLEPFAIPRSPHMIEIADRGIGYYLVQEKSRSRDVTELRRKHAGLASEIEVEIHGRISFAISCLVLVVVGCALGMMFRTANYLSAFAIGVIPTVLCIALVATGQHLVEGDPQSLKMGLGLIWSGNVIVAALGVGLIGWLQRQ